MEMNYSNMKKVFLSLFCLMLLESCGNALDILQGIGEIGQSVYGLTNNSTNNTTTSPIQNTNGDRIPQKKKVKEERQCTYCKGKGVCFACHGSGKGETRMGVKMNCKWCYGKGICKECKGKGVLVSYREVYE